MDYASDIDSYGLPIRKRKRGGMSFLVIATGTIFLAAAWIMAASNPYTELAHRVVEVKPETPAAGSDGRVPLFELAIDEAERSDEPGTALETPGSTPGDGDEAASGVDAIRPGTIIEIGGVAYGPVRGPVGRDVYGKVYGEVYGPVRPGAADTTVTIGLLPDDDLIGPRMPEGMAFEHGLDDELRHAVQRRLGLAGHDAGTPDGIFGPKTREALVAYQAEAGLEESGFADAATVAALENATETKYTAWVQGELKAAKKAQARRAASRRAASADAAPVPQAREIPVAPTGKCRRRADGTIVGHQSLGCDIRGLGSAIGRLFGGEGGGGARADAGFVNAAPDR